MELMEYQGLVLAYFLILTAIFVSMHQKAGLEKQLFYGSIRAFVQLMVMGYLLLFIFNLKEFHYLILTLLIMAVVSGQMSAKRGEGVPDAFRIATGGIIIGSSVSLGILVAFGIIETEPRFIIPLGGMIVGNSMYASSLSLNRISSELKARRMEIEVALSLGATSRQAADRSLRETVKSAMIPSIDSMRTVGLIHLPGMMSGLLLAGASPIEAVKFQLIVVYMLTSAVSITCMCVSLFAYRKFFTKNHQLVFISSPDLSNRKGRMSKSQK